jgi:uncharacterized protein YndB with AHSA1/START domain
VAPAGGPTLTVDHIAVRHAGTWCYIGSGADGSECSFRGVFHSTPSPGGIIRIVEFDGMPGHVCPETVTFTERADTTLVTQDTIYQSVQDRDRMLHYDLAEDVNESIDRLEELLARRSGELTRSGAPDPSSPGRRVTGPDLTLARQASSGSSFHHHRGARRPAYPADALSLRTIQRSGPPLLSRLPRRSDDQHPDRKRRRPAA